MPHPTILPGNGALESRILSIDKSGLDGPFIEPHGAAGGKVANSQEKATIVEPASRSEMKNKESGSSIGRKADEVVETAPRDFRETYSMFTRWEKFLTATNVATLLTGPVIGVAMISRALDGVSPVMSVATAMICAALVVSDVSSLQRRWENVRSRD